MDPRRPRKGKKGTTSELNNKGPSPDSGLATSTSGDRSFGNSSRPAQSSSHRINIIPDLDVRDEDPWQQASLNSCTKEKECDSPPPFDYYRFSEFHRLRALLSQVGRYEETLTSDQPLTPLNPDEIPKVTTDDAHRIFEAMYGPVDLSDLGMQNILVCVADTLNELSVTSFTEDEIIDKLVDEGIFNTNLSRAKQDLKDLINASFSVSEQKKYGNLNPSSAAGEWFNLPRGDIAEIRKSHFPTVLYFRTRAYSKIKIPPHSQLLRRRMSSPASSESSERVKLVDITEEEEFSEVPEELLQGERMVMYTCDELKNLHLYDPKFELSFNYPYRIFNCLGGRDQRFLPRMLSYRILEMLNDYPYGVTERIFWEKFHNRFIYFPEIHQLEERSLIMEFHLEEILFIHKKPLEILLFPAHLEGIADPELILSRVWHAILRELGKHSAIRISTLFPLINHDFKFDPYNWGYSTPTDFVNSCINYFNMSKVVSVHRIVRRDGNQLKAMDFLALNSKHLRKFLNETYLADGVEEEVATKRYISEEYMGPEDEIDYLSNHYSPDHYELMDISYLKHPHCMSLLSCSVRPSLDKFQDLMNSHKVKYLGTVHPSVLRVGLFVVIRIWFTKYSKPEKEWYRAKIIWHDQKHQKFYVYGIDWGFLKYVKYKQVKLMPKGVVSMQPAYAIPAKFGQVPVDIEQNEKGNFQWDRRVVRAVWLSLIRGSIGVRFKDGSFHVGLGCMKWTVDASTIAANGSVASPGLSAAFYSCYRRRLKRKRERKALAEQIGNVQVIPALNEPAPQTLNEEVLVPIEQVEAAVRVAEEEERVEEEEEDRGGDTWQRILVRRPHSVA